MACAQTEGNVIILDFREILGAHGWIHVESKVKFKKNMIEEMKTTTWCEHGIINTHDSVSRYLQKNVQNGCFKLRLKAT